MRAKTVSEMIQQPFSNSTRNERINASYPLSRPQYEDADKPQDISREEIECEVCGRPTQPKDFEAGVCKRCARQGMWQDKFGRLHRQNSRIRHQVAYESKK